MCFIGLQKPYDTVDHTLLWQVLTRIRVPPQMKQSSDNSMIILELVCDLMAASVRIGLMWSKDYGMDDACYLRCRSIYSLQPC